MWWPPVTLDDMKLSPIQPIRRFVQTVCDDVKERRHARSLSRALERELPDHTNARHVDDLLGAIKSQDGPHIDLIRDLVLRNQWSLTTRHWAA